MTTDRLRACVESVARTREVVAARLDVGDGWADRLAQAEADRDRYRREATETSDLLELCLLQHLHLRGHLDDLRDELRQPGCLLYPRDVASRLDALTHPGKR